MPAAAAPAAVPAAEQRGRGHEAAAAELHAGPHLALHGHRPADLAE